LKEGCCRQIPSLIEANCGKRGAQFN
jgi:hypothetical protein